MEKNQNKIRYVQQICDTVKNNSSCFKRKVGAVFVNEDFEILATGYNQPPRGFPHCDMSPVFGGTHNHTGTCGNPCTRTIHAEQNAIVQAAKNGVVLARSCLFCTYLPCVDCSRLLINLRVTAVYVKILNLDGGREELKRAKIPFYSWI